jgi:hypothetical protein
MSYPEGSEGTAPAPVSALCPHCGDKIDTLERYNWNCPPFLMLGFLCPTCKTIVHMTLIPAQIIEGEPSAPGPRIVA